MRNGKYLGLWTGFSVCSWPKPCNYLEIEDSVAIMETAFICEVCCYLKKCSVAFSLAEIIIQSYICTKTFDSLGKKPNLILTALFSWTFKWHSRKHFLLLKINSLIRNIHFFLIVHFLCFPLDISEIVLWVMVVMERKLCQFWAGSNRTYLSEVVKSIL